MKYECGQRRPFKCIYCNKKSSRKSEIMKHSIKCKFAANYMIKKIN